MIQTYTPREGGVVRVARVNEGGGRSEKQTDRQTGRQADRLTGRQAGRERDRGDRQRERQTV